MRKSQLQQLQLVFVLGVHPDAALERELRPSLAVAPKPDIERRVLKLDPDALDSRWDGQRPGDLVGRAVCAGRKSHGDARCEDGGRASGAGVAVHKLHK